VERTVVRAVQITPLFEGRLADGVDDRVELLARVVDA
jgi:hypothetical protein